MGLELRLPARSTSLAELRVALTAWLTSTGVGSGVAFDVVAAASEAASNAIEHAEAPSPLVVEVQAERLDDALVIRVRDFGRWRTPRFDTDRNRGLMLIQSLMTHVAVDRTPAGTVVTMRRDLDRAAT
jgi:anti-sigma regulatory factor (Ser/Thr protein kinase)